MMYQKGDWVLIHSIVLSPEERAPQIPEDTKQLPLEMWVKGRLLQDAHLGETVNVETVTKRIETGKLQQAFPIYTHSFGSFVPEILEIHRMLREELEGLDHDKTK